MQSGADREVEEVSVFCGVFCLFFFPIQCQTKITVKVVSTFSKD